MHVKKGDKVMVITGKDKGKTGVILAAFPKKDRVLVEGVNIVKNIQSLTRKILKVESLAKRQLSMYPTSW